MMRSLTELVNMAGFSHESIVGLAVINYFWFSIDHKGYTGSDMFCMFGVFERRNVLSCHQTNNKRQVAGMLQWSRDIISQQFRTTPIVSSLELSDIVSVANHTLNLSIFKTTSIIVLG